MNNSHPFFDYTSADLEKEAIHRLRNLVRSLPSQCQIFREPWNSSTVVCLDFAKCSDQLNQLLSDQEPLIQAIQALGLANTVVFRIGNKLMGWKGIASPKSSEKG
ncbi:conserved hypothetical protein [Rippkaea orientalis PCC 8801]|uniref:Uncharacterized protein n=1 Tax=Rippkaea orientalis (strain PCC 8801 / RF-1) TaxID=41431 RepID=B7K3R1_RIPO1|nr:hypothetical protein [Rippkaea orientalis]ACK65403.1 conserved hypothetical protein [Rippkaea orientalis PCC 8801]